ncbi:MAG: hypothetical protein KatS3mg105_4637 [Gemmatales bacterium]|nr:MAG: hypothetical protein KatS3mg105_4637 [Gemmatales bacterium]
MNRKNHPSGVTLTEVLVSIFVMGIGLMSLLVLFPLGAMNMAQAIKDDRAAHAGANAAAIARILNIRDDAMVFPAYTNPPPGAAALTPGGSSYPVYVDPIGVQISGGARLGGITRVSHSAITTPTSTKRWLSLPDDINFGTNGRPANNPLEREVRYSWAYLCRQVEWQAPVGPGPWTSPQGVELTVVVYDGRPWLSDGGVPAGERTYAATFTKGQKTVTLTFGGAKPNIRKGMWILDATLNPTINGYFYRIASAEQIGPTTMQLVLTKNARENGNVGVVMDYVVEVFEKGAN